MSVLIDRTLCARCGNCVEVCPGNLIARDESGAAFLRYPEECWGCASCLKECRYGAISYFLGADISGQGAKMRVHSDGPLRRWYVERPGMDAVVITTDSRNANQY